MRKKVLSLLLGLSLLMFGGCLTDISGWDLSACEGEFDTCFELFWDNQEKLLGGETVIDLVFGRLFRIAKFSEMAGSEQLSGIKGIRIPSRSLEGIYRGFCVKSRYIDTVACVALFARGRTGVAGKKGGLSPYSPA